MSESDEMASYYIAVLHKASGIYGDMLLEFMDAYGLPCLKDASLDDLAEFCEYKGLLKS